MWFNRCWLVFVACWRSCVAVLVCGGICSGGYYLLDISRIAKTPLAGLTIGDVLSGVFFAFLAYVTFHACLSSLGRYFGEVDALWDVEGRAR